MLNRKRIAVASLGLTALILLVALTILPDVLVEKAENWVAQKTGRVLAIGDLSINPISFSVEVSDVSLSEKDPSAPFLSWDNLRISLSPKSLFHWAPIIRELVLDTPYLHIEKLSQDSYNFSDLLQLASDDKNAPEEPSDPARFSLNNLAVRGGTIELDDKSLEEPVHHAISDIHVTIPFLGNLPYMVDKPVQPRLAAQINDAPIELEAELKPFTSAQEVSLNFDLDNIDLPHYLAYVPMELPVQLKSGRLNLDVDLTYRVSEDKAPSLTVTGQVDLTSLNIFDRMNEQLFFLPLLQCEFAPSDLLNQQIHLSSLRVYNLEVQIKRDSQGEWNHGRLAVSPNPAAQKDLPPGGEDNKTNLDLVIDDIQVRDGVVYFQDNFPEGGFQTVARDIMFDLSQFRLGSAADMPLNLNLRTDRDETVDISGHLSLAPLSVELQAQLGNLGLGSYVPYYLPYYIRPFGGRLDLKAQLSHDDAQPLLVSNGHIQIRDFSADFNETEGIKVDLFNVSGFSFDMAQNRLVIDDILLSKEQVLFSRDKQGRFSFMSRNFPILEALHQGQAGSPSGPALSYLIRSLRLSNAAVDFVDDFPEQQARLKAEQIDLVLNNVAAPGDLASPVTLNALLFSRGRVKLDGTLYLNQQKADLSAEVAKLPLSPLAPYLAEQSNLVLSDGVLDARLKGRLAAAPGPRAEFEGRFGISRMHLRDAIQREDLLLWDNLQVAGIQASSDPPKLAIDSVTLNGYEAKVLIDENIKVNLIEVLNKTPEQDTEPEAAPETKTSQDTAGADGAARPDIQIGKVILQGGRIDFNDRHLLRPFHADMRELGGRIEGLSSNPETRAEVDLRGSLRNQSPLTISGTLNPLAKDPTLDIRLSFNDIELSPMSSYSGTYLGYLIERGKLNLDLGYTLENHQLKATNKVFLDQFTLGDEVESDKATNLPVKLAVALLKDANGEIHLDIPVYGSLDDPQFSIAGVIWTVIKNLLVKAATSPLSLLGAMAGGGEEDFSQIVFDYGSVQLSEEEQQKLLRMAQALLDRPGIDIDVSGFIDPERDPEGYRQQLLSREVKQIKYRELAEKGALPEETGIDDITLTEEEYAESLWDVYRDKDFPKPRNFIGLVKKLPVAEMEKLILTNTEVTDADLARLARDRALAVQSFLVEQGQLSKSRVFLKEPDITAVPEGQEATRARVELGASVQ